MSGSPQANTCDWHHFVWTWPVNDNTNGSVGVCDLCGAVTTAERDKRIHAAGVAEGRAEVAADRDEAWAAYRAAIGVPESQHQRERMERIALHAEQVEAENARLRAALAGTSPQGEGDPVPRSD